MGTWGRRWSWWHTLPCCLSRQQIFLVIERVEAADTAEVVALTTAKGATAVDTVESLVLTQVNEVLVVEAVDIVDDGKSEVAHTFLPIPERSKLIGVRLTAVMQLHQHIKEALCVECADQALSLASPTLWLAVLLIPAVMAMQSQHLVGSYCQHR